MKIKSFSIFYLPIFLFFSIFIHSADKYYPGSSWNLVSAESQGIETKNVKTLINIAFKDNSTLGVVVIKNGKIIGEKYAPGYDLNSHGTSWSMAKSYYAALIGVSMDRGEIGSLDDKVSKYLDYFNDERSKITIRDLLNMSSGLDFPSHEHEKMFFQDNHLEYAKNVGVEKEAGIKFEYNNVNSMLIGEILFQATGKKADLLFEERILKPLQITDYKLWKDEKGNVMAYCCVDMSARDYSKFGLLFARNGLWNDKQIISEDFVNETFQLVWDVTPERFTSLKRGYSLHWWVSAYEENFKIFNTSGKFGQYTFVDRKNDIIVTRITKYNQQDSGDVQKWGIMKYLKWAGVENAIKLGRILIDNGAIESGSDVITPFTDKEGESKEFNIRYADFIRAIENLSCDCYSAETLN
jgi:CubicO group peptidase (beta-lactamase class C family)